MLARKKVENDKEGQNPEQRIMNRVARFAKEQVDTVNRFATEDLVEGNSINPLLMWALGINDFEHLARYLVYRTLDRSFATSFGAVIEDIVKTAANGKRGTWWDVVKETSDSKLYLCVKSGPSDMDKDQVEHFAGRAKEIMEAEHNALPMIAMGYGRKVWPVIVSTLKKQGLDPDRHTILGKPLFDKVTGDPNFHVKLSKLVEESAIKALSGTRIIDLIDLKIDDVSKYFSENFKDVNQLLQYVFDPPKQSDKSAS
jgi:hypothetical protein